jgi:hypothetical protein
MLFQWLRKAFGFGKDPPISLSEEGWRALMAYNPPPWIPVGASFMSIEEIRKRVDQSEYWRRWRIEQDEASEVLWEKWRKEHPEPRKRERLFMIR